MQSSANTIIQVIRMHNEWTEIIKALKSPHQSYQDVVRQGERHDGNGVLISAYLT